MAPVDTDALTETSDLSGATIGDGEDRHVIVKLDDGTVRRLRVSGAEAASLAGAGEVPGGWWKRRLLGLRKHWRGALITVATLVITGFVLPTLSKISDDRQQEFQAKVQLVRTVNESAARNFSDANQAAMQLGARARNSMGQKVVDRWVAAEGTVDPQIALLFPRAKEPAVRDYWKGLRAAQFMYAALSHDRRYRAADTRAVFEFIDRYGPEQPTEAPTRDPWGELRCGPPTGCHGSRRQFRDAYRWVGVQLLDSGPGLAHAVMDARAEGFKHWPPDWFKDTFD